MLNRVVIRNGVQDSPRVLDELELAPDAATALASLHQEGFRLICVTNQPEVARGNLDPEALAAINQAVRQALPLDDLLVCCHDDADGCNCRKPKPGLLLRAAADHEIDLADSFMVGDRWRDVDAGARAGCRTILLHSQYDERPPVTPPDATASTLTEAAQWILRQPPRAGTGVLD